MHKMKATLGILISLFLFTSVLFIVSDSPCKAEENWIYVDESQRYPDDPLKANGGEYTPFGRIQDALDAANDGDIIKVLPGDYKEDLVIDKSVTLMNDNRSCCVIISSTQSNYIIDITASSVSLEGFTIEDQTNTSHRKAVIHIQSGANDVAIINNLFNLSANGYIVHVDGADDSIISTNTAIVGSRGLKITNSNSNNVYENQIENCTRDAGIHLSSSNNNQIEKNTLRNNEYGVVLQNSNYNTIKNNTIYENDVTGIMIESSDSNTILFNDIYSNIINGIQFSGSNNIIHSNNIYSNNVGVYIGASGFDNTIYNCTIYDQLSYGLFAATSSSNNVIYNNTFRTNTGGNARENGNNQWDNGTLGNYWDDFYGPNPNNENCTLSPGAIQFSYRKHGASDNHPKGIYNIERLREWHSKNKEAELLEKMKKEKLASALEKKKAGKKLNLYEARLILESQNLKDNWILYYFYKNNDFELPLIDHRLHWKGQVFVLFSPYFWALYIL